MENLNLKEWIVLLAHALIVWGLCGAMMGIGMAITTLENALVIHAVAAPVISVAVAFIYFNRFNYTTPLQTAVVVLGAVVFMDVFLVAMVINKSFDMFKSFIGTWLPFILIFTSVYATGRKLNPNQ